MGKVPASTLLIVGGDIPHHPAVVAAKSDGFGSLLVLGSAVAFATSAVLIKIGYAAGLHLEQFLALRFLLACPLMFLVCFLARQNPIQMNGQRLFVLVIMGAVGYAGQSFTFYTALETLPASLVALVVYCYPALVTLAGWVVLGKKVSRRHILALITTFVGVALVLSIHFQAGGGLFFALACPAIFTAYILIGERVMLDTAALSASTLVISGSAITWTIAWLIRGPLSWPPTALAWSMIIAILLVPTIGGTVLFLAGLPRIGGARAALLSTLEPVVTVALATILLRDRLGPAQVIGGALVIASVVILEWPIVRRLRRP